MIWGQSDNLSPGHHIAVTPADLAAMVREMRAADRRAVDFETSGLRYFDGDYAIGAALGYEGPSGPRAWYVPVRHQTMDTQADPAQARAAFKDALEGAHEIVGHNLCFDLNVARADGWEIPPWVPLHDTQVQAYLCDEGQYFGLEKLVAALDCSPYGDAHTMKNEVQQFLRGRARAFKVGIKAYLKRFGHAEVPVGMEGEYACRDIGHTLALDRRQRYAAEGWGTPWHAHRRVLYANEMLLVRALADMQFVGQAIDVDYFRRLALWLDEDLDGRGKHLTATFGDKLDWGNDNQIRDLLYSRLRMPVEELTPKGKPSIGRAALMGMAHAHPGIEHLMEWRARYKIRTTYSSSLADIASALGRLHTDFVQWGTKSGRLSCVAGWAPITTSRGTIRADAVRPGDKVWTHKARWRPVRSTFTKGVDRMYDVRFSNGEVLTCTMAHRLLCSDGVWRSLRECVQAMGVRPGERGNGGGALPPVVEDNQGDRRGVGHDSAQRASRAPGPSTFRGTEGVESSPVFGIQGWGLEPDAREDGQGPPQLDRSVPGWAGLLDLSPQGTASVCSPVGVRNGSGDRCSGFAAETGCSPHRRGSAEQRDRQSGADHGAGTLDHPRPGAGYCVLAIEEVNARGSFLVYDFEVAEDHSYEACGAFNHNSRSPNLQNVPTRHKELAKLVRQGFLLGQRRGRIYCDYSQIELRVLAWASGSRVLTEAYESPAYMDLLAGRVGYDAYRTRRQSEPSNDVHGLVCKRVFGVDEAHPDWKNKRRAAKVINFGVPYGGGPNLLAGNPELRLPKAEAKAFFAQYHRQNPEIEYTRGALFDKMRRDPDLKFVNWAGRTVHGRRLTWRAEEVRASEERSVFASLIQGSAGELTRFSIVRLWLLQQQGKLPAISTSTVHDEVQVDCDVGDIPDVAREVQRVMEDFTGSFGTIPVVADLEVTTTNWAEKKDYAEWASTAV